MALSGNAATIANFLQSKGLSSAGVAGVLGGMQAESGLQSTAVNRSSGATGIAQWLGSRLTALENLARSMGSSVDNLSVQLEYWWQEMSSPQYAGLLHELQTTTNPSQAATDYVQTFERPGPGGDPGAPGFAQTFFNGGVPGGAGNPGAGGGGSVQNVGSGSGWQWWEGLLGPTGAVVGTLPPTDKAAVGNTLGDVAGAIGAIATDFVKFLQLITDLFKPSFWLRVGSFLVGVLCLIGGFMTLKGSLT